MSVPFQGYLSVLQYALPAHYTPFLTPTIYTEALQQVCYTEAHQFGC
jgi:hypothetical protein